MRLVKKHLTGIFEADLTPLIDMAFQLIAFFMVLLNFSEGEANERIQLPHSQLARPPDQRHQYPITIQVTAEGTAIMGTTEVPIADLGPFLLKEKQVLTILDQPIEEASIIIRADKKVPTGRVQELIFKCQEYQFEKFTLRAQEDVTGR
jgi:biopolymer transport protein ExbD